MMRLPLFKFVAAVTILCCSTAVAASYGSTHKGADNSEAVEVSNKLDKPRSKPRSLKEESLKSSKASKCRDIQRDAAFLGIESGYSVFQSELTLVWDAPFFIPSICGCRKNCDKSSKSGKSMNQTDKKSSKSSISAKSAKQSDGNTGSKSNKIAPLKSSIDAKSLKQTSTETSNAPIKIAPTKSSKVFNVNSQKQSSTDTSGKANKIYPPQLPEQRSINTNSKSSKLTPIRHLSSSSDVTGNNFVVDDDGYIIEGVQYHIFVRNSPFDFFQEDFETLIVSADHVASDITNFTFTGLMPRQEYQAFVLATIDGVILPNQNVVNITISHVDPVPKVNVTRIPSTFAVTRGAASDQTFGIGVNSNTITNDDMTTEKKCSKEEEERGEPCANPTCGGIDADDSDFEVEVFDVTICDGNVGTWGFTIGPNDTILFDHIEEEEQVERIMHVWKVNSQNDTCIVVSAIDTSPTYLFEEIFWDSQIDPYYDLAHENINQTCGEYCIDTSQNSRQLFEKDFPFASLSVFQTDSVSTNVRYKKNDGKNKAKVCAKGNAEFKFYARATAFLRVRIEVSLSKFKAELGGGYNYIAGFEVEAETELCAKLSAGKDLWAPKKKIKKLFVAPPGIPIFISYQPYVAYDAEMEFELENEFELNYEVSGSDYGGIVVDGGFKQVTQKSESTPFNEIVDFNDSCSVELEATVGVRAGIRLKLFDNKGLLTDPALRAGIDAESVSRCDGSLKPSSSLPYDDEEPQETKVLNTSALSLFEPFRLEKLDIDMRLSLPIRSTLGIRFELPFIGGFWIVKIKLKFEIDILSIPILTLPQPEPVRGEYQCLCYGYPACTDSGYLEMDVEAIKTIGKTLFFNNALDSPTTFVLVFDDSKPSNWTANNFEGTKGSIQLSSGSEEQFCCGAADMPVSELFLVSTPQFPSFDHSLISYEPATTEDCYLTNLIEGCVMDQFYNDTIGDKVCQDERCNWVGNDFCVFHGVDCNDWYSFDRCDEAPENNCERVVSLIRNGGHKENGALPGEIKYLKALQRLDLGFVPECETESFCLDLDSSRFPNEVKSCLESNCTTTLDDLDHGGKCWVNKTSTDAECHYNCSIVHDEVLSYQLACTNYTEREDNEKLTGLVPAEIWAMKSLVYANLSNNAFTGLEEPFDASGDYSNCIQDPLPIGDARDPPLPRRLQNLGTEIVFDLRNNDITGDLPCDICDLVNPSFNPLNANSDSNYRYIIVDCLDEITPVVNCRCCVGGINETSSADKYIPCSSVSIVNHEAACGSPSSAPSAPPSLSTQPSTTSAPSGSPSVSTKPSEIPTQSPSSIKPTASSSPSAVPTVSALPTPSPTETNAPTDDCDKKPTTPQPIS